MITQEALLEVSLVLNTKRSKYEAACATGSNLFHSERR